MSKKTEARLNVVQVSIGIIVGIVTIVALIFSLLSLIGVTELEAESVRHREYIGDEIKCATLQFWIPVLQEVGRDEQNNPIMKLDVTSKKYEDESEQCNQRYEKTKNDLHKEILNFANGWNVTDIKRGCYTPDRKNLSRLTCEPGELYTVTLDYKDLLSLKGKLEQKEGPLYNGFCQDAAYLAATYSKECAIDN